jgi:hypothetical protein
VSNSNSVLLPCEYFPCVAWFKHFIAFEQIFVEQHDYFERASLRNRCYVAGANGMIMLSIPLEDGRNQKKIIKDVRISYATPWQDLHWKTISSCYRRSPFFEYFEQDLAHFFKKKYHYLIDCNLESIKLIQILMQYKKQFALTSEYFPHNENDVTQDCRKTWNAHNFQSHATCIRYNQTFETRNNFQANLSMLDLIFCEGKMSLSLLNDI